MQTKFADDAWLAKIWLKVVHDAALETGITKSRFPQTPIWTAEQILDGQFLPA